MCADATSAFIGFDELETNAEQAGSFPSRSLILEVDGAKRQSDDWRVHNCTGVPVGESDSTSPSSIVQSVAIPDKN